MMMFLVPFKHEKNTFKVLRMQAINYLILTFSTFLGTICPKRPHLNAIFKHSKNNYKKV
jgi:hypothetical protein